MKVQYRPDAHHQGGEQHGYDRTQHAQQRRGQGDSNPRVTHASRLLLIVKSEHVLAADATQDSQPRHRISRDFRELALFIAVLGLPPLQRFA